MSKNEIIFYVIMAMFAGFSMGFGITLMTVTNDFEKRAIEHGAARYNPETADFEWIKKENKQ